MQPSPGSTPLAVVVLVWGLACLASACCPCNAPCAPLPDGTPDDSEVEFSSMMPSGPPPDVWSSEPPSWGQKLPSSPQASLLLKAATPQKRGNVAHGLVLCNVYISSDKRYDTFADPDPAATLTLGKHAPLYIRGGEDRLRMMFTVPGVTVEEGEPWKLLMKDRDVTSDDRIGESTATYTGSSPLDMSHEDFRAACYVFPREEVEPYAVEALKEADRALSAPELKRAPELSQPKLGYPDAGFDKSKQRISGAAALLTWGTPRVQERLQRLEKLETAWGDRADAAIQAELKQSEPDGWRALPGWEGIKARVTQTRCAEDAGCSVTVELKNTGTKRVRLKLGQPIGSEGFAALIFKGGAVADVQLKEEVDFDGIILNLASGEVEALVYVQPEFKTLRGPQKTQLVGVQFGKHEQAVILRPPSEAP